MLLDCPEQHSHTERIPDNAATENGWANAWCTRCKEHHMMRVK